MYIYGVLKNSSDELEDVKGIFKRVCNGMPEMKKLPESEHLQDAVYAVVYEKEEAVAAGMMVFHADGKAQIRWIGVLEEKRRQRYGDMVLRMLVSNAFQKGINQVYACCDASFDCFFKAVGFKKTVSGYAVESEDFVSPCHTK